MMTFIDYIKDYRVLALLVILAGLFVADVTHGIGLGIEFVGGTQITLTLAHPVNPLIMSSLISTLENRLSQSALGQPIVQGEGNSQVLIQIPTFSKSSIDRTVYLIEQQGVFEGLVNGREALNGSGILGDSLQSTYGVSGSNVTWQVNFIVTAEAAKKFSSVVFGQAYSQLYMFLDRPDGAILLMNNSRISGAGLSRQEELGAMSQALLFGNRTIPIEMLDQNASNWKALYPFFNGSRKRYSRVILERGTPEGVVKNLTAMNYSLIYATASNMTPSFTPITIANGTQVIRVTEWPAIGLLTSSVLEPGITTGGVSETYAISGSVPPGPSLLEENAAAQNTTGLITSVLNGGALPVQVIVNPPTTIAPTLGKHFEVVSAAALLAAIIAVTITIVMRYRKIFLIGPIILTTMAELFIIASVVGLVGYIDLPAVAGMIAVVGTGVDAQIIITDEILTGSRESNMKSKFSHAFYVVWADAILLIVAMVPLIFSTSLITVIGFALSTVLGALLGALLTRPAYASIVGRRYLRG